MFFDCMNKPTLIHCSPVNKSNDPNAVSDNEEIPYLLCSNPRVELFFPSHQRKSKIVGQIYGLQVWLGLTTEPQTPWSC